jgi:glutamate synthase domain-containing protein 3
MRIDAKGMHYRVLNEQIRNLIGAGEKEIILENINGQRYIGDGIKGNVRIKINGTPGNDLGAFMDGPGIIVHGNAQDGTGNTMSGGSIIVNGSAGDIVGHSMRGGKIYIKEDAGYRVGIHMKSFQNLNPVIVIGGSVQDFPGEYMAGGLMLVLGINKTNAAGNYIGTGMHGGTIFTRGKLENYQLGKEVKKFEITDGDWDYVLHYINEYCEFFSHDIKSFERDSFVKLAPLTHRPYVRLYAY